MVSATYKRWQARYNQILLDVHETPGPHVYLALESVRKVLPKLRSNSMLQREYGRSVGPISKDDPKLYFSESALRKELQVMASAEATMFVHWLHHHLYSPAAKKRGEDVRPDIIASDAKRAHRSTPAPTTWLDKSDKVSFLQWMLLPLTAHWRGERTPKQTLIGSIMLAAVIMWLASIGIGYLNNPDNYFGNWQTHRVGVLVLFLTLSGVWIWWGVGVMRFALKHLHKGNGLAVTFSVFLVGLTTMVYATASSVESGHEWVSGLFDRMDDAKVDLNTVTNRIVFKGDVGYGSYKRLQRAISENPSVKLLELDSHGGYVIEGLAMARLIKQSGLDTVAFRHCDSACTLMFAAGNERYLGPRASIGFHRSWVLGEPIADEWTGTEYLMARFLEGRGVNRDFVNIAFSYPGDDLWIPKHGHMLDARYATGKWPMNISLVQETK